MNLTVSVCLVIFVACRLAKAENRVEIGRDEFKQLMNKVDKLEKFAEDQKIVNRGLRVKLNHHRALNKAFKDLLVRQDNEIKRQKNVIQEMAKKMFPLSNSSLDSKTVSKRQAQYGETTVAFLARISAPTSVTQLSVHQNLVLGDVVTNIGGGYNPHQGVFIPPISGLYLITASLRTGPSAEFWADFVVNGNAIVRLNERGTDKRHGQSSQTIIMHLNKGDNVSLQNHVANDSFYGDKYSSFAGVLLQEVELPSQNIIG